MNARATCVITRRGAHLCRPRLHDSDDAHELSIQIYTLDVNPLQLKPKAISHGYESITHDEGSLATMA